MLRSSVEAEEGSRAHGLEQPKAVLTVGEVAQRAGVTVSALHFYERKRLISSERTFGNQRRYRRDVLRRVALIRIAQGVGIPLDEVAEALDTLPQNEVPARQDWVVLSELWRERLDSRIRRLTQIRDSFSDCVGCGCLSIDRCPAANLNDQLGRRGPGPRRLLETD